MVPTLDAIQEFMAQQNIAIISDNNNSGTYSYSLRDKLDQCGYTIKHIRPCLEDFDEDGRCLCVAKLPSAFSALILDLHPSAASVIIDEAIIKGINHIWLLPRAFNCILREKGTDNELNLIYNRNILNYLEIPNSIHRLSVEYVKYAFSALAKK
jgi:predicted CoA-binding protein